MSVFTPPAKRLKKSLQSDGSEVDLNRPFSMQEIDGVFVEYGPNLVVHGSCAVWFLCMKYNVENPYINGIGSDIDVFSDSLQQSAKITFRGRPIDFLKPSQLNVAYHDLYDPSDSMNGIDVITPKRLRSLYEDELEDMTDSAMRAKMVNEKIRLLTAVIEKKEEEKENKERRGTSVAKKLFF